MNRATGFLGVVLAAFLLVGATSGTLKQTSSYFVITGITQSSDSVWARPDSGWDAECLVRGTWGGATADVETEIPETLEVVDTDVSELKVITADTNIWVSIRMGSGRYRLEVTGGDGTTDLVFHCRRVSR